MEEGEFMGTVINEFKVSNYVVLILDQIPNVRYSNFRINGKTYKPVPIYDAQNSIAIESNESFIGNEVEFIS